MAITDFNFEYLTPDEREGVHLLNEFKITSSSTMIILDWGKYNEIEKYLSKFNIIVTLSLRSFTR